MTAETIFALSSAPGRAGIAVVRASGPEAGAALERLAGRRPEARRAALREIRDPESGETIDQGLVLWFPGPGSVTGEDLAEFHIHGGPAVIGALLAALDALDGLRPAEPGEFTRRAFDNGKMDLAEVEGLADLIEAETELQRRQALRQFEGGLGARIAAWRDRLLPLLAHLEAYIDFPDEDLPEDLLEGFAETREALLAEMAEARAAGVSAERLREGLVVAIVGPPNAGKSSLLNRLAGREAAIVSERAGTTRDVVEVRMDLAGYPATLADTAGLREAAAEDLDPVEHEGMARSRARAGAADIVLAIFDRGAWPPPEEGVLSLLRAGDAVLLNKCDLYDGDAPPAGGREALTVMAVSALSGEGIARLEAWLAEAVAERVSAAMAAPGLTRLRHRRAVEQAEAALARCDPTGEPELAAEDLRGALGALGRITGQTDVEDLLDVIFRDFCIGK